MNDIERAIGQFENFKRHGYKSSYLPSSSSIEIAIEALEEIKEWVDPKPLTLEQLKERIGKPVFVVGANPQKREWGIVHNGRDEYGGKITLRLDFHSLITLPINSKVKFYDHEPKEKANE